MNHVQSRFTNPGGYRGLLAASVVIGVGFLVAGGIYLGLIDEYIAQVLTLGGINVIVALGLNLISGYAGQLALGQAGFMAVGAYTTAFLVMQVQVPLLPAILTGGMLTAGFGILIGYPTLQLRGDYLAIVTLSFGEIIRVIMVNLEHYTGGAAGLKGIPSFTAVILHRPTVSFLWVYCLMTVVILGLANLIRSAPGRAILAVREDEVAAGAMGINVFYHKMLAFTLSAFIAGLAGGLYAPFFRYLNPTMFNFLKSVDFLIIVVFGGMGSITGTVIAGFVLTYLQEFLRILSDYRLVIYPILLILMMLYKPSGLLGEREFSLEQGLIWLRRFKTQVVRGQEGDRR
ncbi:MAG TPA: branched-chain amino acid ABC transporter permease [Bacillota bacterium]|nr:branched-chain amino acid ABC transporter permease [Bacillota bacterium]